MAKVKVDKNKCIGCGACTATCPEVFELRADGKSHVKDQDACSKCDCKMAAENCPVSAITYKE